MYPEKNHSQDPVKVEAFADKVARDTSGFMVTIMAALGDHFGIFKDLAANGPATHLELALRTSIHPRYAQEWLNCLYSAGYLEFNPLDRRFALPSAHIPALADEGGPSYFGGTHQMLLGMLSTLNNLEQAFRDGRGIPMTAYDARIWEGMERDMNGVYKANLIQNWIHAMPQVKAKLERGIQVADIGCGSGRILILLAQAFPNSDYVGFDPFTPVLERARSNAREAGLDGRIRFERLDPGAESLPETYDLITTFEVIHDSAQPLHLLRKIREALKPGGRYICMDINCSEHLENNTGPLATARYGASILYCMSVSLAEGGQGIGTMGLPEIKLRELCLEAGFSQIHRATPNEAAHHVYEITP